MTVKATVQVTSKVNVTVEAANDKELIEQTSFWEEVAGRAKRCDACDAPEIRLSHRNVNGNDFYALRCTKCGAELKIGQRKAGGFFIKDRDVFTKFVPEGFNQDTKMATKPIA